MALAVEWRSSYDRQVPGIDRLPARWLIRPRPAAMAARRARQHAHKAKPDALVHAFQRAAKEPARAFPPAAGAAPGRRGPEPPPREDAHGAQEDQVLRQRAGHQGRLDQKTARHPQALNPEPPTSSTKAKNKN